MKTVHLTRRGFLIGGGLTTAAVRIGEAQMVHHHSMTNNRAIKPAPPLIDPEHMSAFVDPLPLPGIARPIGRRPGHFSKGQVPFYKLPAREFFSKVHRDLPPTRFWGYGNSMPGPTIEARSGEEIQIEWPNQLPAKHFLTIDHNLMGAEKGRPESRTVAHVHGGRVPPESDGWPEDAYAPGKSASYYYPNNQDAALLWYHDHSMGINRLNVCAGMAGLYVIRDSFEDALNLPKGQHEIPLVLMDRMIGTDGQIYYPVSELPDAPWVPEYTGNATLINGKVLPYLDVQPRKYRFRILNASNARFYNLSLGNDGAFQQIGTDQGLLSAPVPVARLTLAPGERADVVVDFAGHRSQRISLTNLSAPLMQFRVASEVVADPSALPSALRPISPISESDVIRTRQLALDEVDTPLGDPAVHLLDGKYWHDPVSEKPVLGTTEIWELLNLTDDTHPIHLHLVRFRILDRRPIDVDARIYDKKVVYTGNAEPPDANEAGWKDTVRATPGANTRILVKFEGYTGRYVWHCHILEHEDNEMMRPYEVVSP